MNEDIHPIIQQIKDNVLNLIAGESIRLLKASTVQSVKSDCHTPFTEVLKAFDTVIKQASKAGERVVKNLMLTGL